DARAIMRLPMDETTGTATGKAEEWAKFPRTRIDSDGLALMTDQAVIAVTEEGSDLWLVEFPERRGPAMTLNPAHLLRRLLQLRCGRMSRPIAGLTLFGVLAGRWPAE